MKIYRNNNSDFDLMLEYGHEAEDQLVKHLLDSKKYLEIKTDALCSGTGNVVVEFAREQYGKMKKAGILVTKAEWYFFLLDGKFKRKRSFNDEINDLKRLCLKYYKLGNITWGGRDNRSKLIKIPIIEFITFDGINDDIIDLNNEIDINIKINNSKKNTSNIARKTIKAKYNFVCNHCNVRYPAGDEFIYCNKNEKKCLGCLNK